MIFGDMPHGTIQKELWSTWPQPCLNLPDGKIGAEIRRRVLLPKALGSKGIPTNLTAVPGSIAYSLTQIKEWCARFETADLWWEDQSKPGHPLHVLGKALPDFLEEFLFTIAEFIAQDFGQSRQTTKEIIRPGLWLGRFPRRCVPYSLSEAQRADRTAMTNHPLRVLRRKADYSFSRIMTRTEFWFLYWCLSDQIFAASRDKVIPRKKTGQGPRKLCSRFSSTAWVWSPWMQSDLVRNSIKDIAFIRGHPILVK
jgi:hypothetical protein